MNQLVILIFYFLSFLVPLQHEVAQLVEQLGIVLRVCLWVCFYRRYVLYDGHLLLDHLLLQVFDVRFVRCCYLLQRHWWRNKWSRPLLLLLDERGHSLGDVVGSQWVWSLLELG